MPTLAPVHSLPLLDVAGGQGHSIHCSTFLIAPIGCYKQPPVADLGALSTAPAHPPTHSPTLPHTTAGVPMGLEQPLRQMVAPVAGARPPAAAFAGCQYFQGDVLLRALKVGGREGGGAGALGASVNSRGMRPAGNGAASTAKGTCCCGHSSLP